MPRFPVSVRRCLMAVPFVLLAGVLARLFMAGWSSPDIAKEHGQTPIAVIYCTDLFDPPGDPDDHFDLAALYSMPEIDIRAIVLDQGAIQETQPGRIPVEQMNHLTGRGVPCATGLSRKLRSPVDQGLDEPERFQAGQLLIQRMLEEATTPVTIVSVGSLRDVAAAFNRHPALFQKKVSRLFAFIGDGHGTYQESNVGMDPQAYACVMNSGLDVYWVPCFDGGLWSNEGDASFWQTTQGELLRDASVPVLGFFAYALLRDERMDPLESLNRPLDPHQRDRLFGAVRNVWGAAVFASIANRTLVQSGSEWRAARPGDARGDERVKKLFEFRPVSMHVTSDVRESFQPSANNQRVNRFHILDRNAYGGAMTSVTRHMIGELSAQIAEHRRDPMLPKA